MDDATNFLPLYLRFVRGIIDASDLPLNVSREILQEHHLVETIKKSINETGLAMTVEENPRLCGWGAEISSLITEHCFSNLKGPVTRITTPHVPLPSADILEDNTIPSVDLIVNEVIKKIKGE